MAYLTGKTLEYFAAHMKSCVKTSNKRKLEIIADSHEAADYMGRTVKSIFGAEWYECLPNANYATLKFEYNWQREDAVKYVNRDVDSYRNAHSDSLLEPLLNESTGGETEKPSEDGKKTDWTTYIIIGFAAVALILLVIPKRKK